jgi:cytochrome c peroxidase
MLATACTTPPAASDAGAGDASTDAATDAADAPPDACDPSPTALPGDRAIAAGSLLPEATFDALHGATFSLTDFHRPCAPSASLVVLRSMTAWSARSGWQAEHTSRLLAHPSRARFAVVDVLTAGPDNLPSTAADLDAWSRRYDAMPDALGLDPTERYAALAFAGIALPIVVFVDARDLRVVRVLYGPRAGEIEHAIDETLARLDGTTPPAAFAPTLTDGRFSEDEWALISGMRWPDTLPPDPSNAHADDPAAAALGATLFDDGGLSPAGVSCLSCHQAAHGYGDALPVGHGVTDVTRNTPTILGSALLGWAFWDGRADSLWAQALGPIESAAEMGSSRLFVAHRIADTYRTDYEAVFGPLADLSDAARFPPRGAPGDAAWDAMSAADQETVTRIFVNVGKAIEAFERTQRPPATAFDAYLGGDMGALSELERDGLREFVVEGCLDCHHGPLLSNGAFHDILMPGAGTGDQADLGRFAAYARIEASPFRRVGAYSDDTAATDPLAGLTAFPDSTRGAFRTPTLRALRLTAPYGHAGTFASLMDVVSHYSMSRLPHMPDARVVGTLDRHVLGFDPVVEHLAPLVAFLSVL